MKYLFALCAVLFVCSASAQDDNPGAALLDQATEEKLKAASIDDMGKVIALCLQAKKEGLSGENLNYCNQLLASTQLQRGIFTGRRLLSAAPHLPSNWIALRKGALDDLEEATQFIADQPLPFMLIAQLNLMPDGNAARAAEALEQAEKAAKDDRDMLTQITVLKLSLQEDPAQREKLLAQAAEMSSDIRLMLLYAASLLDMKKVDAAIDVLKKVLEKEPENVNAMVMLVDPLANTQQFDDALKVLEALEESLGDQPKEALIFQKAKLLALMDKTEEAVKLLSELREQNPGDPLILIVRSEIHLGAKDFDNALKDIDAALRIIPERVEFRRLKAGILLEKGDNADARKIIEELLYDDEDDLRLALLYIQVLVNDKEYDKALEQIDKIKEGGVELIEPVRIGLMRAQILSMAKKSRLALDELNALFEDDQENIEYLRFKGNLLISIGRHSEAVKAFEAVLEAEPDDEVVLNNLSWLLSTSPNDRLRDGKRALELATKASELTDYKKAYILSTLGAAYAELGDFDKAMEWSQKCIELAENDPSDKERLDDLKKELESYKKRQPYREAMEE